MHTQHWCHTVYFPKNLPRLCWLSFLLNSTACFSRFTELTPPPAPSLHLSCQPVTSVPLSLLCPNSEKNIYAQCQPAESSLLMEKSPRWEPRSSPGNEVGSVPSPPSTALKNTRSISAVVCWPVWAITPASALKPLYMLGKNRCVTHWMPTLSKGAYWLQPHEANALRDESTRFHHNDISKWAVTVIIIH